MQLRINRNNLISPVYIGAINEKQLKMRIILNKIERAREVLTLRANRGGAKTAGKGCWRGNKAGGKRMFWLSCSCLGRILLCPGAPEG